MKISNAAFVVTILASALAAQQAASPSDQNKRHIASLDYQKPELQAVNVRNANDPVALEERGLPDDGDMKARHAKKKAKGKKARGKKVKGKKKAAKGKKKKAKGKKKKAKAKKKQTQGAQASPTSAGAARVTNAIDAPGVV